MNSAVDISCCKMTNVTILKGQAFGIKEQLQLLSNKKGYKRKKLLDKLKFMLYSTDIVKVMW
ncbi:hypothetical protein [Candidatus Magnetominusculus xianensis]|uniref:Transposase n=1 Tax=Candidatus Magnetominusculus xianensis TaxID=1748249 RepID=A0ABR5SB04_9BACT|nr:hypothetical protein [Candidatus Magnetominusculus xianensis]KWT75614.1 hypothetical protein ASN18_3214 [Candidatus Magnetominusculus xianensis]MBF0403697.1 hypothetical protein [Nitrospirota bacterium]